MHMVGHVRFHSRPDPDYLAPYVRHAVEYGYVILPPTGGAATPQRRWEA